MYSLCIARPLSDYTRRRQGGWPLVGAGCVTALGDFEVPPERFLALLPVAQAKAEFEQRVVHVERHVGGLRHHRRHVAGQVEGQLAAGRVLAEYRVEHGRTARATPPE